MNHLLSRLIQYTKNVVAIGTEAKEMIGKTPEKIIAIRPLKDGVIADYDLTTDLLKHIIRKASKKMALPFGNQMLSFVPLLVPQALSGEPFKMP